MAPGIGHLFLWPGLIGALLLLALPGAGGSSRRSGAVVVAGTALVLLEPAIDVFSQLAQPSPRQSRAQIPWVVLIPAVLAGLVVELVPALTPASRPPPCDDREADEPTPASVAGRRSAEARCL